MTEPHAVAVAGLGFGDEGKGTVVQALVSRHRSDLVVRYNGGAQAAHNVVLADGRHHTFAQFGSGTLQGARTHLSKYMLVDPMALHNEASALDLCFGINALELLTIDRRAPIITPYHRQANHLREARRGADAHGSCGMGIGETRKDSLDHPKSYLCAGDLIDPHHLTIGHLYDKVQRAQNRLLRQFPGCPEYTPVAQLVRDYLEIGTRLNIVDETWLPEQLRRGTTIFEGAQGVLLDQIHGFAPHTTWSDTTFGWADELLTDFDGTRERIGVTRTYHTRHGAGPLPTERDMNLPEAHNIGGFAGAFRTGDLDFELLQYAIDACGGINSLAVTHLDRRETWDVCMNWRVNHHDPSVIRDIVRTDHGDDRTTLTGDELILALERYFAPVSIRSYGPTLADKRFVHTSTRSRVSDSVVQKGNDNGALIKFGDIAADGFNLGRIAASDVDFEVDTSELRTMVLDWSSVERTIQEDRAWDQIRSELLEAAEVEFVAQQELLPHRTARSAINHLPEHELEDGWRLFEKAGAVGMEAAAIDRIADLRHQWSVASALAELARDKDKD